MSDDVGILERYSREHYQLPFVFSNIALETWSFCNRSAKLDFGEVLIVPDATTLSLPESFSMIPYPRALKPGSIPKTRIIFLCEIEPQIDTNQNSGVQTISQDVYLDSSGLCDSPSESQL